MCVSERVYFSGKTLNGAMQTLVEEGKFECPTTVKAKGKKEYNSERVNCIRL